jgi:hypothetical protein
MEKLLIDEFSIDKLLLPIKLSPSAILFVNLSALYVRDYTGQQWKGMCMGTMRSFLKS